MKLPIFFIVVIFISGCASFTEKSADTSANAIEARNLVFSLQHKNNTLKTCKGIGKIKLWNKNSTQTMRVAWVGEEPKRLRIGILTIAGQPAASIAGNGKWVYFVSHAQQQFYKKKETDPSLREILSIPVKFSDIIALLCGRVPIREYHSAVIIKEDTGDGYVLTLKSRWGKIIEKIFLDNTQSIVRKIEFFNFDGLVYQAEFDKLQTINTYSVPFSMVFSNENNEGFQLEISRYWANISIAPSKFVLNPIED